MEWCADHTFRSAKSSVTEPKPERQARVHRLPNPDEPEHLAAVEVYRHPATEVDVMLAAAIPRRRTDRRHYSSWDVPANYIALMGARTARAGVMLRTIESLARL
jgi:hypothetical protein